MAILGLGERIVVRRLRRWITLAVMVAVSASIATTPAYATTRDGAATRAAGISAIDAFAIGFQAYQYAYPIVLYGQTQLVNTNVAMATSGRAPANQFAYGTIAGPSETDVVLPNVNVIYNNAFLNLAAEPMVLHIPDTQSRFFIQEILDAWTDVRYDPGTRLGTPPGDYLITGPGWNGQIPDGIQPDIFAMPTNLAWIAGRNFTTGDPDDVQIATDIQRQFTLVPLSSYGQPYTPPPNPVNPDIDMKTPPIDQVTNMSAGTFFEALATLWLTNPPQSVDTDILAKLAQVGLVPGQPYDLSTQPRAVQFGMNAGARAAYAYLSSDLALLRVHRPINGWTLSVGFDGEWGTNYFGRAVAAYRGLGTNAEQDAVYGYANRDHTGRVLDGSIRYSITFPAESLPPVEQPYGQKGFWSVTAYTDEGFLGGEIPNVIGSTEIAAGTWKPNADGSFTIVIQQDQPTDGSNWLKPPSGAFILLMRMYSPLAQVFDPTDPQYPYEPPVIRRLTGSMTPRPGLLNLPFMPRAIGRITVPR